MSDDAVLEFVKSIDGRTARMEKKQDDFMKAMDDRVSTIENTHEKVKVGIRVALKTAVVMVLAGSAVGVVHASGFVETVLKLATGE